MSKDTGGPAFPFEVPDIEMRKDVYSYHEGMTLRDYFAAKALPGVLYMVAHGAHDAGNSAENCALEAYKLADAMLVARVKP